MRFLTDRCPKSEVVQINHRDTQVFHLHLRFPPSFVILSSSADAVKQVSSTAEK